MGSKYSHPATREWGRELRQVQGMAKMGQARGVKQVESTNVSDQLMFQVMKTEGSKTFLE